MRYTLNVIYYVMSNVIYYVIYKVYVIYSIIEYMSYIAHISYMKYYIILSSVYEEPKKKYVPL